MEVWVYSHFEQFYVISNVSQKSHILFKKFLQWLLLVFLPRFHKKFLNRDTRVLILQEIISEKYSEIFLEIKPGSPVNSSRNSTTMSSRNSSKDYPRSFSRATLRYFSTNISRISYRDFSKNITTLSSTIHPELQGNTFPRYLPHIPQDLSAIPTRDFSRMSSLSCVRGFCRNSFRHSSWSSLSDSSIRDKRSLRRIHQRVLPGITPGVINPGVINPRREFTQHSSRSSFESLLRRFFRIYTRDQKKNISSDFYWSFLITSSRNPFKSVCCSCSRVSFKILSKD